MSRKIKLSLFSGGVLVLAGLVFWQYHRINLILHQGSVSKFAAADELVFYEGLPHNLFESGLLEGEIKEKETVVFHNWHFYATPLQISDEDVTVIKELLSTKSHYTPHLRMKKCGGFNPDCLVELRIDDEVYRILICLGCGEVQVHTSSHFWKSDITIRKQLRAAPPQSPTHQDGQGRADGQPGQGARYRRPGRGGACRGGQVCYTITSSRASASAG